MKIDAHQHFWQYNPITQGWISDSMSVLRRDFSPAELQKEIKLCEIDGTIAVQAEETYEENYYLQRLALENDFIIGIVGWMDLLDKRAEEKMIELKSLQKLVGFRTITQGAPDEKYLSNKQYIQNIKLLANYDYTYDLLVHHSQLPSLIRCTEQLPNNRFIIDHIGKPDIKHQKINNWKINIKTLAANPNIYCKLSGMTTEADYQNWRYTDLIPYMEIAAEYFGVNRLCFGSDWPVCLVAGSYSRTIDVVEQFCAQLSAKEKNKIFGENTKEFYKLKSLYQNNYNQ
jgi:L-fuconolactonase